jgi:hypothetical protein
MNVTTVITIKLKTTAEGFESEDFQDVINTIKTGKMSKEFKEQKKVKIISADCTYWTDYKALKKK